MRLVPVIGQPSKPPQSQSALSHTPDTSPSHPPHISYSIKSARPAPVIGPINQQPHTEPHTGPSLAPRSHHPTLPASHSHQPLARPAPVIGRTAHPVGPHTHRIPSVSPPHLAPPNPTPGLPRFPVGPTPIGLHIAATPPHTATQNRPLPESALPSQKTATKKKKKTPKPAPSVPPPPPPLPEEVSPEEISHFLDTYMDNNRFLPLHTAQLRVGFLNIDSLYGPTKLPYVFWLMERARIDIVMLLGRRPFYGCKCPIPFIARTPNPRTGCNRQVLIWPPWARRNRPTSQAFNPQCPSWWANHVM